MLLSLASSMRAASWSGGIGAVMVFSLGSGGRPTVRCFWCASKSEQAYRRIATNQRMGAGEHEMYTEKKKIICSLSLM